MGAVQGTLGNSDRRVGRYVTLFACFGAAALLGGLILFWLFRSDLEPGFAQDFPFAFQSRIEEWHWIAALAGLWIALSIGMAHVIGGGRGLLASGILAMGLGLGAWVLDQVSLANISSTTGGAAALSAFCGGWLIVQFARLDVLKAGNAEGRLRDARNAGQDLSEHFVYLIASLIVLSLVSSQLLWPDLSLLDERNAIEGAFVPSLVVAGLVIAAFVPLLTGFWINARREANSNKRKFWRSDVVTPLWLATTGAGVIAMTTLAYYAALYATDTIGAAISYATFVGVFLMFVLVIVLPHMRNFFRVREEERLAASDQPPIEQFGAFSLDAPSRWLSYLDTLLVKVVAPLSGGTQRRLAHVYVVSILSLLSLLGLVVPRPFGLAPIALGILLAIALGRRWAWVEEDRETASRLERTRGSSIHVGFDNDLKDEALTGYAGLFILVPLTLYQIQDISGFKPELDEQPGNIILTWVMFFGAELAKAVPFVDWWDIYGRADVSSTGKHLTFLSRAAVDLIILAALFQALSIWQRNRVQTTLFKDGHLHAFDPFKEREFFQQGIVRLKGDLPEGRMEGSELARAQRFARHVEQLRKERRLYAETLPNGRQVFYQIRKSFSAKIEEHIKARGRILEESSNIYESPAPYSRQRLAELIESKHDPDLRAGAQWMIDRWSVLVGTPKDQLRQIAQRWESRDFPTAFGGGEPAPLRERRIQKMDFERILVELSETRWINAINKVDASNLMQCLRRVRNDLEFDFARILALEVFGKLKTVYAVMFLSKFVLREQDLAEDESWRHRMIASAEAPDFELRFGRADMRERVYDAAWRICCNSNAGDEARKSAYTLLEWMGRVDGAQTGRDHAQARAKQAEQCLRLAGLLGTGAS